MDMYRKVRPACAEGLSQREAARHFNISRDSVGKMLAFSIPPGYRRKAAVKRPKLDAFTGIIDAWLEGDREVHRKQRHTSKRLFERLRDVEPWSRHWSEAHGEGLYRRLHGREGGGRSPPLVRGQGRRCASTSGAGVRCSCRWRIRPDMPRPISVRVSHFAPSPGVLGPMAHPWQLRATMATPHSDACFSRACPAATSQAWVDGHVHAFAFLGKVPASILCDNDRCPVSRILPPSRQIAMQSPAGQRTGRASGPRSSAGSCRITCCATAMGDRARAMSEPVEAPLVRARWRTAMSRGWSAPPAATSWCPSPGSRPGRSSTPAWRTGAAGVRRFSGKTVPRNVFWSQNSCAASPRRSGNALRAIWRQWPTCQPRRSTPAIRQPDGSARRR